MSDPLLVLDAANKNQLPRNFRISEENVMGGGQFSEKGLQKIITNNPNRTLFIVDLRQESHGFIDGNAVSWYGERNWANSNKTDEETIQHETELLHSVTSTPLITVSKIKEKDDEGKIASTYPLHLTNKNILHEQALVERHQLHYKRFFIRDHGLPSDQQVDDFIYWSQALPTNSTLYFHCRAGRGRTTFFMIMTDMMHHAKQDSFETILKRQHNIGGKDFLKSPLKQNYKHSLAQQRMIFLQNFYRYCATNTDHFKTRWSDWNKLNH